MYFIICGVWLVIWQISFGDKWLFSIGNSLGNKELRLIFRFILVLQVVILGFNY